MDIVDRAAKIKSDSDSDLDSDWEDSSDEDEAPKVVQPAVNKKRDARLAKKADIEAILDKKVVVEGAHDSKTGKLNQEIVDQQLSANTPALSVDEQVSKRLEIERLNKERELEFARSLMGDLNENGASSENTDAKNRAELAEMGASFGEKVGSFSFSAYFPDMMRAFLSEACTHARSEHIAEIMNHMISINNQKLSKGKKKKKRGKKLVSVGREDAYGGYGVPIEAGLTPGGSKRAAAADDSMLMDAMTAPLAGSSSSDDDAPQIVRQESDDDFM